jgi:hypothetical protein
VNGILIRTGSLAGYIFWTRTSPTNPIESNESFWTIIIGERSTSVLPRMVSEYPGWVRSFIPIMPLLEPQYPPTNHIADDQSYGEMLPPRTGLSNIRNILNRTLFVMYNPKIGHLIVETGP